ncbi:MAG: hypothetical protein V1850_01160, partial [Candidatus Bathyarchaeota archaeon]
KKTKTQYTRGEINKVIDSVVHPWARGETEAAALIIDSVLHAMVEEDAVKSLQKFTKYTLPKILDKIFKNIEQQKQ